MTSRYEHQILAHDMLSFFGHHCVAGQRAFSMDICGNLTRCSAVDTEHGNLFAGTQHFDVAPEVCDRRYCGCPYQGIKYVLDTPEPADRVRARLVAAGRMAARHARRRMGPRL